MDDLIEAVKQLKLVESRVEEGDGFWKVCVGYDLSCDVICWNVLKEVLSLDYLLIDRSEKRLEVSVSCNDHGQQQKIKKYDLSEVK